MKTLLCVALFAFLAPALPVGTKSAARNPPSLVQTETESGSVFTKYLHKTHYNHNGKLTELSEMLAEPGAADDAGNLKQLVAISARTGKQRITALPGGPYNIETLMQGFATKKDIYNSLMPQAASMVPEVCPCTGPDCPSGKAQFFITYGPPASGKGYVIGKIEEQMFGKKGCISEGQVDTLVDLVPQKRNAKTPTEGQDMYWIFRDIGEKLCDYLISVAESKQGPIVFEMLQPDAWVLAHVTKPEFKKKYMSYAIFPLVTPAIVFERSYKRSTSVDCNGVLCGRLPDVKVIQGAFEASTSKYIAFVEQLDKAVVYNNDGATPKALATLQGGVWTIDQEVQERCLETKPRLTSFAGEKPAYLKKADAALTSLAGTLSTFFCALCCKGTATQQSACKC